SNAPRTPTSSTLSLHDALPIYAHRLIVVRVEDVRYAPFVPHFLRIVVLVCPFTCSITAPYASMLVRPAAPCSRTFMSAVISQNRSEEHTSELQSRFDLVCHLLL